MSIKDGEVCYYLQRSLKYSNNGQSTEAEFILLREPGMEHQDGYTKLSQYVSRAQISSAKIVQDMNLEEATQPEEVGEELKKFHEQAEEMESESEEIEEALTLSLRLSDIDNAEFLKTFEKICLKKGAKRPLALVDGLQTVPLNKALWDRLHPEEAFCIAIKWCVFFVTAADIRNKNKSGKASGSDTQARAV